MKISIAMATYNGAAHVREQLASFAAQTRLPDELVVTDDQSRDGTAEIVHAFSLTAPFRVRLEINPQNLGVAQNFNRALGLCSGQLVLLSDQDDVWLEGKVALLERASQQHPDRSCFLNDALLADGELRLTGATKMGQIRAAGLPDEAMVMGCCAAFRRDLLDCLLPIPVTQPAHDNWLVQVADLLGQTVRLAEPAQYYRRHGNNVSDFFVNRLVEPRPAERMVARMNALLRQAGSSGGFGRELQFLRDAAERLSERRHACAELVGAPRAEAVLAATRKRAGILADRLAIRSLPRLRRVTRVWALWRSDAYRSSGRLQGAVKDLVIAPESPGAKA